MCLEVSLERSLPELVEWLDKGVEIFYIAHHAFAEIPSHPGLTTKIDTSLEICTSSFMSRHLGRICAESAVTGALGDDLCDVAQRVAQSTK